MEENYLRQLGLGVASLTFGVALAIFIFAVSSNVIQLSSMQTVLLGMTSFLLMLRFWWRYTELFVKYLPSKNYLHFLLDFTISFFGIIAVLLVADIQLWAIAGAGAMTASLIRCALSDRDAKAKGRDILKSLRRTIAGSVVMLIVFCVIYYASVLYDNIILSAIVLAVVVFFVIIASLKNKL